MRVKYLDLPNWTVGRLLLCWPDARYVQSGIPSDAEVLAVRATPNLEGMTRFVLESAEFEDVPEMCVPPNIEVSWGVELVTPNDVVQQLINGWGIGE